VDTDAVVLPAYAAFEHGVHFERTADFAHIAGAVADGKRGSARHHAQFAHTTQRGD
jgi:hypothetical protein